MLFKKKAGVFVMSLDFELFWGVLDSLTVAGYKKNIEGVWRAIPRILTLFHKYSIHGTWATVGMVMCRDYTQWCEIRPSVLPGYTRQECSTYTLGAIAREYPNLFFARPLVLQILEIPGQELATHTYSHFYCGNEGVTSEQFTADVACGQTITADLGVQCRSLVFPCNQVREDFLPIMAKAGIQAYRGNPNHYFYRNGHFAPGGLVGRALRFADSWVPLTGSHVAHAESVNGVVNVPASLFLRPWSRTLSALEVLRVDRLKRSMTVAARSGRICHLWWHPHNFGVNMEQNLAVLESILKHYCILRDQYGMSSLSMVEAAKESVSQEIQHG